MWCVSGHGGQPAPQTTIMKGNEIKKNKNVKKKENNKKRK
jgi:hypothetical protein